MNYNQLRYVQRSRLRKNKTPMPPRFESCQYCGEALVRLKTVARCHHILHLSTNHVTWVDAAGTVHRHGILTKDHLVPKCKGGSNDTTNIVYSCGPCNVKKGDKTGVRTKTGQVFLSA